MPAIPRDPAPDSTLALIRDPYRFISARCRRWRSDVFETRVMLQKTICLTGPEAARLFYNNELFCRAGAAPRRLQKSLFGRGTVQGLDGEAHRRRKRMLMSILAPEHIRTLVERSAEEWEIAARRWASADDIVLYDELHEPLLRSVCAWAGVPLNEHESSRRKRQVVALFDGAGGVGIRHWKSRLARKLANRWMRNLVRDIRAGRCDPPQQSAAHIIAFHRDGAGDLLSAQTAAVELLNVIRPVVAVSVFVTFIAHALHCHPECQRQLQDGGSEYRHLFVQEVRRFYPFFPAVIARVRRGFEWNGHRFAAGHRVMLDLYGTDHDEQTWQSPETFEPKRFRRWDESPFNFIPQGGGDHEIGHRCAGEWLTIALMGKAVYFLTQKIRYTVPEQDLRIDWSRLPALPRSRMRLGNVRLR